MVLLAFSLAPVFGVGVWFLRADVKARENVRGAHRQFALLAAETVETSLADMNRSLGFVTELERGLGGDRFAAFKILQRAAAAYPQFVLLVLLDGSGREVARFADSGLFPGGAGLPDSARDPLRSARGSGEVSLGAVAGREGLPVLPIAYPLSGGGFLYSEYSLRQTWERISRLSVGSGSRVLIVGHDGRPVFGFDKSFPEPGWRGPGPLAEEAGWLEGVRTAAGSMVGAYAKVRMSSLGVLSLQPRSEAYAIDERAKAKAAAALLLLCVGVTIVAYWLARRLTGPLLALVAGARRVAEGDFKRLAPETGWGEIRLLSRTFNEMMRMLVRFSEMQVDRQLDEKAKVEALIHTIPDGVILAGFDNKVLYVNSSARGILDERCATMPSGLGMREALRVPALREAMEALHKGRARSFTTEFELAPAGYANARSFLCRAVSVMREGRELGILLLLRDITMERNLDRMKQEFFHSVVHDLRAPMGSIDGFVQLIAGSPGIPEKALRYSEYVRHSCRQLRLLVSSILDLAKIEAGQMVLQPVECSAKDFVEALRPLYAIESENRGVAVSYEVDASCAAPFRCDKGLIERVLMNLVGNAFKYTPHGGSVTVRAAAPGAGCVEFSVQDTGAGIPADKQELVFGRFKQVDSGRDSRMGYGLGLSVCKKIVELHGGRIWVESQPGKGSRFAFQLPQDPRPPHDQAGRRP